MRRSFDKKVSQILKENVIGIFEGTSPSPSPHLPVDISKFFTNFIVTQKKDEISKKKEICFVRKLYDKYCCCEKHSLV